MGNNEWGGRDVRHSSRHSDRHSDRHSSRSGGRNDSRNDSRNDGRTRDNSVVDQWKNSEDRQHWTMSRLFGFLSKFAQDSTGTHFLQTCMVHTMSSPPPLSTSGINTATPPIMVQMCNNNYANF